MNNQPPIVQTLKAVRARIDEAIALLEGPNSNSNPQPATFGLTPEGRKKLSDQRKQHWAKVRLLQERTGVRAGECSTALNKAKGDVDKALALLKPKKKV